MTEYPISTETEAYYAKVRGDEKFTVYEGTTPLVAIYEFKVENRDHAIYTPLFYGYRALNNPADTALHIDRSVKAPGEILNKFFEDQARYNGVIKADQLLGGDIVGKVPSDEDVAAFRARTYNKNRHGQPESEF